MFSNEVKGVDFHQGEFRQVIRAEGDFGSCALMDDLFVMITQTR